MKQRFLAYLQFEKRYSSHTVTAYRNDLEQFSGYLQQQYDLTEPEEATPQMIRSWLAYCMEQGTGPRSVSRKISTLKSFFKYLMRMEMISLDPMKQVTAPRISRRLPVFVEKDKMTELLDGTDFGEGYPGFRNRLIIELFYASGIRLSELTGLKETDIDFHHNTIKVLGKRNKERLIPFGYQCGIFLKEYLNEKERCFGLTDILFLTDKGNPVYPRMIYRIVTEALGKVTTLEKRSPHVLRHTFATHLLNDGAELNAVKELLGHASLAATQVYTHNTIEKLKRIYKQAHPKA